MARWFRSYAEKLENPKVIRLSDALYRAWDMILCIACKHDGKLPPVADIAILLRKSEAATQKIVDELVEKRFLEHDETFLKPHDWQQWQYQSDVSTTRVKRFRERQRNVSVTPSDTESDTDTDSVPIGTAADAAKPDALKALFDDAVGLLGKAGVTERNARSLVGKWRSVAGDEAVRAAIDTAAAQGITEPVAWLQARLGKRESWNDRRLRLIEEVLK